MPAEKALELIALLRAEGYQAYLAGGCVRDSLLGVEPKDWDIATDARPERVLTLFPQGNRTGAHFGVVRVDGVEIATFRSDQSYSDGRRPDAVRYETSAVLDAERRDFTINGLFLDVAGGEILDHVGGLADLERRLVRAIGDPVARFREDHLRLLRAVRIAARYEFAIEDATFAAMRQEAASIRRIAAERVRDELNRILMQRGSRRGFELLAECGLLVQVLPEVEALRRRSGAWERTLRMLDRMTEPRLVLAWGVLLHGVDAAAAHRILLRLRQANADIARVTSLIGAQANWPRIRAMGEAEQRRFLRVPGFADHLELQRLACVAAGEPLDAHEFARERLAALKEEDLYPLPLLTGDDLIAAGLTPGPAFARLLRKLEDAQLEGSVRTRDEALALITATRD